MAQNNTEIAYNYIRKKVLEGDYPPGYSLQTNDLAEETGVSRTPVRDALRMLETDGLVVIRNRTGAKVRQILAQEYKELCEIRQAMEGFGAGLAAARHTEGDLPQIKEHLDTMEYLSSELAEAKDPLQLLPKVARVDSRFHLAIMASSKNELMHKDLIRLHLIIRVVAGRQRRTLKALPNEASWRSRRLEIQQEHEAIYSAIISRDVSTAREAMEDHIQKISQVEVVALEQAEKAQLQDRMGV